MMSLQVVSSIAKQAGLVWQICSKCSAILIRCEHVAGKHTKHINSCSVRNIHSTRSNSLQCTHSHLCQSKPSGNLPLVKSGTLKISEGVSGILGCSTSMPILASPKLPAPDKHRYYGTAVGLNWSEVLASTKANMEKFHHQSQYDLFHQHQLQTPANYMFPTVSGEQGTTDLKRFLNEVGTDPREARYWLKQFKTLEVNTPFAVIQVDPDVFSQASQLENLASCISFLQRNQMYPLVIHGHYFAEDSELSAEKLRSVRSRLINECIMLTSMLEAFGTPARPLFSGSNVLHAKQFHAGTLSGHAMNVNSDPIRWCIQTHHVPIIPAVGETPTGQIVALDLWSVTEQVSKVLQPLKVMKINTCGGFVDEEGHVIPNVNLPADLETEKPWFTPSIKERITLISDLLYKLPSQSSVVITSFDKIVQELFTHHGSGTFFKITEPIYKYTSLENVDTERLESLLNLSFDRTLKENYIKEIENKIHTVYLSEQYNAAAVVTNEGVPVPYLDKFAVPLKAQGEGTGEMLWEQVRKDYKQLFWRSRGDNPINSWYFRKAEGSWSNGKWTVFWYGILQHTLSSELIDLALSKDSSFCT